MSVPLILNGVTYNYPSPGDKDRWGAAATAWAQAITAQTLKVEGGLFTLLDDVDFGATFGLMSMYFSTRAANPASVGIVRLAHGESIVWRNNANDNNLRLTVNASDELEFNGVVLGDAAPIVYDANVALQAGATGLIEASTVTSTELGYLSGVTSSVQDQFDNLVFYSDPLTTNGDLLVRAAGTTDRLAVGDNGDVLKVVAGQPAWAPESVAASELDGEVSNIIWSPASDEYVPVSTASWATITAFGAPSFTVTYAGTYLLAISGLFMRPRAAFKLAFDIDGQYIGTNPEVLHVISNVGDPSNYAYPIEDQIVVALTAGAHTIEAYWEYNSGVTDRTFFMVEGGLSIQVVKLYDKTVGTTYPMVSTSSTATISSGNDVTGAHVIHQFPKRGVFYLTAAPLASGSPETQRFKIGSTCGGKWVRIPAGLLYGYHSGAGIQNYKMSMPMIVENQMDMLDNHLAVVAVDGRAFNHNGQTAKYTYFGLPYRLNTLPLYSFTVRSAVVAVTTAIYVDCTAESATISLYPTLNFDKERKYLVLLNYGSYPSSFAVGSVCYSQARITFNGVTVVDFLPYVHGGSSTADHLAVSSMCTRFATVTLPAGENTMVLSFAGDAARQPTTVNNVGPRVILMPLTS